MNRLMEGQESYVIDATNYGNVSRYINHRWVLNCFLTHCDFFYVETINIFYNLKELSAYLYRTFLVWLLDSCVNVQDNGSEKG